MYNGTVGLAKWVEDAVGDNSDIFVKMYHGTLNGRSTKPLLPTFTALDVQDATHRIETALEGIEEGVYTVTINKVAKGGDPYVRTMRFTRNSANANTSVAGNQQVGVLGQIGQLAQIQSLVNGFKEQGRAEVEEEAQRMDKVYDIVEKQQKKIERLENKQSVGAMFMEEFMADRQGFMQDMIGMIGIAAQGYAMVKNPSLAATMQGAPQKQAATTTVQTQDVETDEVVPTEENNEPQVSFVDSLSDEEYALMLTQMEGIVAKFPGKKVNEILQAVNDRLAANPMMAGMLFQK